MFRCSSWDFTCRSWYLYWQYLPTNLDGGLNTYVYNTFVCLSLIVGLFCLKCLPLNISLVVQFKLTNLSYRDDFRRACKTIFLSDISEGGNIWSLFSRKVEFISANKLHTRPTSNFHVHFSQRVRFVFHGYRRVQVRVSILYTAQ